MGGAGKSAHLSRGKLDRFCLATFEEESGNVHVVNDTLEAFKAAVAQIHQSKPVAVMSAIGNRGSEATHVLDLLIKKGSQFQKSVSWISSKFAEKCEQDGLYAVILRNSIKYPAKRTCDTRDTRVGLVFLNAVYSGKNVILYQKLAMLCMTVSSMFVVVHGFDGSQENLVKMEDLLDAYTRSDSRGSLQFATAIFSYKPVEEGMEGYEDAEDFVTNFLDRGEKNSLKDKLRNVVSLLHGASIPLRIAVVEDLIKVYSKGNENRKKLKLFLARTFERLDASRLTSTVTADIPKALRLLNETATFTLNTSKTSANSATKSKKEEAKPEPTEIAATVPSGGTCQLEEPRHVSDLTSSITAPTKISYNIETGTSANAPSELVVKGVRREESLTGVEMPLIQPRIEDPSSSSIDLKTDPVKRTDNHEWKGGAEGSIAGSMMVKGGNVADNLAANDRTRASNVKCDSVGPDVQCTASNERSNDEKSQNNATVEARQRIEQRATNGTKLDSEGKMKPDLPDDLEKLGPVSNQPLLVGATANQVETGNPVKSEASKDLAHLSGETKDERQIPNSRGQDRLAQNDQEDSIIIGRATAVLKRNPVEQDPLSAPLSSPDCVTSLTTYYADWALSESPDMQEDTKPDFSRKIPTPLPKYQILERIKSIDVNTKDMTAINLHRDFQRLVVLLQVYTANPKEMKGTFTAEVDHWTTAYANQLTNPELKHTFQFMQLDLLNTFAYHEEYYRLIRERFENSPLNIWYSVQSFAEDAKNHLGVPKFAMTGRLADMLNTVLHWGISRMLQDQERRNNEAIQLESLLAKRARDESLECFNNILNQVLAARAYSKPALREVFIAVANGFLQVFEAEVFARSPAFKNERESLIQSMKSTYDEKSLINERNCVRSRKEALLQRKQVLEATKGVGHEQTQSNNSSTGQSFQKTTTENLPGTTLGILHEHGEVTPEISAPVSYLHKMGKVQESNQTSLKSQQEVQNPVCDAPSPSNDCIELETTIRELEDLLSNGTVPGPVVKVTKGKVEEARGFLSNPSSAPMGIKHQVDILKMYVDNLRQCSE